MSSFVRKTNIEENCGWHQCGRTSGAGAVGPKEIKITEKLNR